jgi:peptide/nickel transport system substrate-binding protein
LVVAACGGDDDAGGSAAESASSEPASESAAESASSEPASESAAESASSEPASESASSEPASETASESPSESAPSEPAVGYDTEGRTMRVGSPSGPPALSPRIGLAPPIDFVYMSPIYDRLVELNGDGTISPMLATAWEQAADGLSTTFELRDDVTFHDGTPFDAAVVVANVEGVLSGGETVALRNLQANGKVTGAEVVDDYTVRMITSEKSDLLPYWLALSMAAGAMINPNALADPQALTTTAAGSGPYMLKEILQDRIVYEKNPDYWDEEVLASSADTLEIISFGTDQARLNALQSGQIDVMSLSATVPDLDQIVESNGFNRNDTTLTARALGVTLNLSGPPFDNPRVRQALNMAIDREAMADVIGRDSCIPTLQPMGAGFPGHVDELDGAVADYYDPDAARAILEEEGVLPLTINGVGGDASIITTAGQILQAFWEEIGVTFNFQVVPVTQVAGELSSGNYALSIGLLSGSIEPGIFVESSFINRAPALGSAPDEVKALFEAANAQPPGSAARIAGFEQFSRYVAENPATHLTFCIWTTIVVAQPDVVNLDRNAMQMIGTLLDTRHFAFVAG